MTNAVETFEQVVARRLRELGETPYSVEQRAGLPSDAVRNVLRAPAKSSTRKSGPTLLQARAICDALGLELYFGPRRPEVPIGFHEPQTEFAPETRAAEVLVREGERGGWARPKVGSCDLPLPVGFDGGQFEYVHIEGDQVRFLLGTVGAHFLVEEASCDPGELAVLTDREGRFALREIAAIDDATIEAVGWAAPGTVDVQFREEWARNHITSVRPVRGAFASRPEPGVPQTDLLDGARARGGLSGKAAVMLLDDELNRHGLTAAAVEFLNVADDAMAPAFVKGDQVLVALGADCPGGSVVAVEIAHHRSLKRLSVGPDGSARLIFNDNPALPFSMVVTPENPEALILGPVVWHGRWLSDLKT